LPAHLLQPEDALHQDPLRIRFHPMTPNVDYAASRQDQADCRENADRRSEPGLFLHLLRLRDESHKKDHESGAKQHENSASDPIPMTNMQGAAHWVLSKVCRLTSAPRNRATPPVAAGRPRCRVATRRRPEALCRSGRNGLWA